MHRLDPLVIAAGKIIRQQHIFWIIIVDLQQTFILPLFRFLARDLLRHLHIELFSLARRHKIHFAIRRFANVHLVATAQQFKVNNIFQTRRHTVLVVAEHTVAQRHIRQIKFFLRFQDRFSPQIVA